MLVNDITIIDISPCIAYEHTFVAVTMCDADLTEILPYMNATMERTNYQAGSKSLRFHNGNVGFMLRGNKINVRRFTNKTELYELLDWLKELINKVYETRDSITPIHESSKIPPVLKLFGLLPKTNCQKCGESTCMAFAAKLNKMEAEVAECLPLIEDPQYAQSYEKLIQLLG